MPTESLTNHPACQLSSGTLTKRTTGISSLEPNNYDGTKLSHYVLMGAMCYTQLVIARPCAIPRQDPPSTFESFHHFKVDQSLMCGSAILYKLLIPKLTTAQKPRQQGA